MIAFIACMAIPTEGQAASSPDSLWEDIAPPTIARRGQAAPESYYRLLRVDITALERTLGQAPFEERPGADIILSIPMPNGGFQRFLIEESPVMAPALATKFPEIKTYRGISLDDPQGTARFDLTPKGFHAIFHSSEGTVYIDPDSPTQNGLPELYRSYFKRDFKPAQPKKRACQVEETESPTDTLGFRPSSPLALRPSGDELRTYRIAIAATGEYTCFVTTGDSQACEDEATGTVEDAMAAIVTTLNRVDFIYEREVAVRFELVKDNDLIIYTDPQADPYTNNDGGTMLGENQMNLDNVIGSGNYDIGHVFSTGGGGVAVPATVCQAGDKAKGVTGSSRPLGDPFDVDFVAHEIGHQFSAHHTFNGTAGACTTSARKAFNAYEPGSGSTIMAYAGICGDQNLQLHSDPYFHGASFDQIVDYTTQSTGNRCPLIISTLNQAPVGVDAGLSYTLPKATPFTLTGAAIDPDGDPLTYNWEEFDLEEEGNRPLFRSFPPTGDPSRTFPRLSDLLNNTSTLGEQLPAEARDLTFRFTARDNRAGGGGVDYDEVTLQVTDLAGPFRVTESNSPVTWASNTSKLVTWEVANTDLAPVNCAQVHIRLSINGGNNFSEILTTTANDGKAVVTVPDKATTQARLKVACADNIFFDISNTDFTITGTLPDIIFADGFES